jgi:hypothetical protein
MISSSAKDSLSLTDSPALIWIVPAAVVKRLRTLTLCCITQKKLQRNQWISSSAKKVAKVGQWRAAKNWTY